MPKIRMLPGHGIVGEDRKDWLEGEVHQASALYAAYLVWRRIAEIVEDPPLSDATPSAAPVNRMSGPSKGR